MTKASCSECPSTYELIPPPDPEYSEPKENPTSDDYIKRIYECDEEGHRNTIYWQKKEFLSASNPPSDNRPYMSTKYGREYQSEFDRF
jgi:acyl-ACP thioesterase